MTGNSKGLAGEGILNASKIDTTMTAFVSLDFIERKKHNFPTKGVTINRCFPSQLM